jgi:hypothetical protein
MAIKISSRVVHINCTQVRIDLLKRQRADASSQVGSGEESESEMSSVRQQQQQRFHVNYYLNSN